MNCTRISIRNTIAPIIKSFPPTNEPNVSTTLPGSPVPSISLVEETFNDILKIVVNKRIVGNAAISNTSFTNNASNKIISAIPMLKASITSNILFGNGIIKNTTAANIYIPTPTSVFLIAISTTSFF